MTPTLGGYMIYEKALSILESELMKFKLPCIDPKLGNEQGMIEATTQINNKKTKISMFISRGMYKKGEQTIQSVDTTMLRFQMSSAIRKHLRAQGYSPDVDEDAIRLKINSLYKKSFKKPKTRNDSLCKEIFREVFHVAQYTRWQQDDKKWATWIDKMITKQGDLLLKKYQEDIVREQARAAEIAKQKEADLKKQEEAEAEEQPEPEVEAA